jgi:hypothetical protein
MRRYITSGNDVPVTQATVKANDLARLIELAERANGVVIENGVP